ncbi:MAG: hypothetical protein VZQ83_04465 [Eubacterium sp.]|nr:hypothetical protein [Eubacterium sp.]
MTAWMVWPGMTDVDMKGKEGRADMGEFKEEYLLSRQEYGTLFPYVMKEEVHQLFWNGRSLWVEDSGQGRYVAKDRLSDGFVKRFALLMSNKCGCSFNLSHPVFEWENAVFYLQMLHESVAGSGTTLLLRKKEHPRRPDAKSLVESGFCDEATITLLKETIREESSFLLYGNAHSGKLDLLRFITRYIPPESRIVTVEGEEPLQIAVLNPDKDVTELTITKGHVRGHLREMCRGIDPRWLLGNPGEGTVVCEMVEVMDQQSVNGGLCVTAGTAEDVVETLFPWEEERKTGRIRHTLQRVFPLWIGVDDKGISSIERYEKGRVKTLYKRDEA